MYLITFILGETGESNCIQHQHYVERSKQVYVHLCNKYKHVYLHVHVHV